MIIKIQKLDSNENIMKFNNLTNSFFLSYFIFVYKFFNIMLKLLNNICNTSYVLILIACINIPIEYIIIIFDKVSLNKKSL